MLAVCWPFVETLAQSETVDTLADQTLKEVQVVKRRSGVLRLQKIDNATLITGQELLKAACCNLGESFTTNLQRLRQYEEQTGGQRRW